MTFLIADSFTASFNRLAGADQKAVKASVFDLQMNPSGGGLQMHRIDRSRDPDFWSARVNGDVRLVVHRAGGSTLLAYVGHHDDAYAWAERRRIEAHPKTGAIQIVEVRERVEEVAPPPVIPTGAPATPPLFARLSEDQLLGVGVPPDWVADLAVADEDRFLDITDHLPAEASEALLHYATSGRLPEPVAPQEGFAHPDTQRRIRLIGNEEELAQALDYPWERWGVFLHPSQRAVVERRFGGPARVSGSAGTGKTVVALHRAVRLAKENPQGRVLLTTFSDQLADSLQRKLAVLAPPDGSVVPRIQVNAWGRVAEQLFELAHGGRPRMLGDERLRAMLAEAAAKVEMKGFTPRFLESEWRNVIDAWGIDSVGAYATVPRMGRRAPLGPKQRERLWAVFGRVADAIAQAGLWTGASLCRAVATYHAAIAVRPFAHVVVDEAQDLGPAELTMLRAIANDGADGLFFAGDLGQRIFQHPFSWAGLGVDVRGRSSTLKVCYRTSRQIRAAADKLLPPALRDPDGNEEVRGGTISVFEGPAPVVRLSASEAEERDAVAQFLRDAEAAGIAEAEMALFVRTPDLIGRAEAAVAAAALSAVVVQVMHFAKGLEFRAVAVMACDEAVLPLEARVAMAADEGDLDDIYETERQLFYVACTRAREALMVSGVAPGSAYLQDFEADGRRVRWPARSRPNLWNLEAQ